MRSARPVSAMASAGPAGLGLELGRALRDERVRLADEARTLPAHLDDHLAPLAEGVGHGAPVADRDRTRALPVPHDEVERAAVAPDRPVRDRPRELVAG